MRYSNTKVVEIHSNGGGPRAGKNPMFAPKAGEYGAPHFNSNGENQIQNLRQDLRRPYGDLRRGMSITSMV
jgi:hypothetical protein